MLAEKYKLTTYDATYLELANRLHILLAILDDQLDNSAIKLSLSYRNKAYSR